MFLFIYKETNLIVGAPSLWSPKGPHYLTKVLLINIVILEIDASMHEFVGHMNIQSMTDLII